MHTLGHAEQVREECGDPQVSNCEETNILFLSKRQAPVHPTNHPWFFFNHYFMLSMLVHYVYRD
jgi:hypothetical protein